MLDLNSKSGWRSISFSHTTPDFCKKFLLSYEQGACRYIDLGVKSEEIPKLYFVSAGFSNKHKVKISDSMNRAQKTITVEYQCLKQLQQYQYICKKLNLYEFSTFTAGFIYFETTFEGNIHFHGVVVSDFNKQCIKAEFLDCFGIKKGIEASYTIHIQSIKDCKNISDYLFNKQEKKYEEVNQQLFKPLRVNYEILQDENILIEVEQTADLQKK